MEFRALKVNQTRIANSAIKHNLCTANVNNGSSKKLTFIGVFSAVAGNDVLDSTVDFARKISELAM